MTPGEPTFEDGSWEGTHWSGDLPYRGDSTVPAAAYDGDSPHWHRWHYSSYPAALLIAGVVWWSLVPLVVGYVLTPITIHLDSRYLESVSPGWQRDTGLYVLGAALALFILVPMYLYRRRELRR
ncbi:hypothetical protein BRC77_01395 [Halobacteriales archaeon QH_8_64_26]|nr:MAG: hypothetical protein BRC77_01395 [Halobacteriales archaeon QH_8_64_26]